MAQNQTSQAEMVKVQYVYTPIIQYQPVFANIAPVENKLGLPPHIMGILQTAKNLSIRQHVKLLPKTCCSCPPCVKQENTYSIYAGLSREAEAEFLRVDEVSDDWNRCCCAPYHPWRLEARQYIPAPGSGGSTDWDHLKGDVNRDWSTFSLTKKQEYMADAYKHYPPLFSVVRNDGQRCCCKIPCSWLNTFVCFSCCQDGVKVYSGGMWDPEGEEKGRPNPNADPNTLLGAVEQPVFGGWCFPTLHLKDGSDQAYGKVEGPFCFGGWSEMCCDFRFNASRFDSPRYTGDLGHIIKRKPDSFAQAGAELISNADNYSIEFDDVNMSAEQKFTVLSAQLLADYMYFDGNTQKCSSDQNAIYCYFWYCNIIGAICPCMLVIPTRS